MLPMGNHDDMDKQAQEAVLEQLLQLLDKMDGDKLGGKGGDGHLEVEMHAEPSDEHSDDAGDDEKPELAAMHGDEGSKEDDEDPEMLSKLKEMYDSIK